MKYFKQAIIQNICLWLPSIIPTSNNEQCKKCTAQRAEVFYHKALIRQYSQYLSDIAE